MKKITFVEIMLCTFLIGCGGIPQQAREDYEEGKQKYQSGNYEQAISSLRGAIARYPDYIKAHFLLGESLRLTQRYNLSIKHYEKVLKVKSKDQKASLGLLFCSFKQGSPSHNMGDFGAEQTTKTRHKEKRGLSVGVQQHFDEKFCQKFFGLPLTYDGVLAVFVSLENTRDKNAFEFDPSNMVLSFIDGAKSINLKPLSTNQLGYPHKVIQGIMKKMLVKGKVFLGERKQGFVLFNARKYAWNQSKLKKNLRDSLLEFSVKQYVPIKENNRKSPPEHKMKTLAILPLNKQHKRKRNQDKKNPPRYNSLNLTFKFLFD